MLCERTCQQCEQPLERRHKESTGDWERRKFCSRSCKTKAQMKERQPVFRETRELRQAEREYVISELEFLLGTDNAESLASRLGYKNLKSLRQMVDHAGREDLSQRLLDTSMDRPEPCPDCLHRVVPSFLDEHRTKCRGRGWGYVG